MCCAAPGQSEISRYAVRNWQTQDGLPNNQVQAIAQTAEGYLWIGTARGLVRFDGMRFKVFNPENTLLLKSACINALTAESGGGLLIGTDTGLLRFRRGHFSRFSGEKEEFSVRAICRGSGETLWVGATNGLFRVYQESWQTIIENESIRSVCEDNDGSVWIAADGGLKRINDGQFGSLPAMKGRGGRAVECGLEAIWAGGRGDLTRITETELKQFSGPGGVPMEVNALHEDRGGTLWIGTASGLICLGPDGVLHEIKHEGGSLDSVFCIFEDREGSLWVGARDGLYRVTAKLFATYTKEHGLANAMVTSVRGAEGPIWIGTWGGGLHKFENGRITRYAITNDMFNNLVLGLFVEKNGTLWFGTDGDGGMFRRNIDGRVFRYWQGEFSNLADPSSRAIMLERQKPRVWVGTPRALNVAYRRQSFWRYTTENGLAGTNILALAEDAQGDVWVGTDQGMTQFKGETLVNYSIKDGLPHNTVTALYEDAENSLWIATEGGLCRRRHGLFTSYTTRNGLFSDQIFEIVEDNFQRLWMTCGSGVFWVAKADFSALTEGRIHVLGCVSYGKGDGLGTVACNNMAKPSAWKAPDGRLLFATVKGLAVVDPAAISRIVHDPPQVLIEQILCDREKFDPEEGIALPPGRGELEFEFTALSFVAPERNRFKYRLDGLDTDWNDAGVRRSARYNNVPPGEYRFRVVACNSAGIWNDAGIAVGFTLRPHYWQTWGFRAVLLASLLGCVAGLYKVRISRLRAIERMRLRIASDLHDEIGSSIGSIALLAQKIRKDGPGASSQESDLAAVQRIATQSANAIRDIVWFINPQYDTMQDLLFRMKEAGVAMLGDIQLRFTWPQENLSRKLSPEFRRNIFLMFKEVLANITRHSRATRVEIDVLDNNHAWMLMVRDNGVGFDPDSARRGNGLGNLRQRAQKLGGSLEIRSQPGEGAAIVFSTRKGGWYPFKS
jgi:ligand-binding sensor domain-containing protein/signal transduction histidine kinase